MAISTVAVPEEVLVDDEKDGVVDPVPVLVGLDAVEQRLCIDLLPRHDVAHHADMVLRHRGRNTEHRRDRARDRHLEAGG